MLLPSLRHLMTAANLADAVRTHPADVCGGRFCSTSVTASGGGLRPPPQRNRPSYKNRTSPLRSPPAAWVHSTPDAGLVAAGGPTASKLFTVMLAVITPRVGCCTTAGHHRGMRCDAPCTLRTMCV